MVRILFLRLICIIMCRGTRAAQEQSLLSHSQAHERATSNVLSNYLSCPLMHTAATPPEAVQHKKYSTEGSSWRLETKSRQLRTAPNTWQAGILTQGRNRKSSPEARHPNRADLVRRLLRAYLMSPSRTLAVDHPDGSARGKGASKRNNM